MTTETLTLSDFLLARIADEERDANALAKDLGRWQREHDAATVVPLDPCGCQGCITVTGIIGRSHDPAYLLAECEAKRRIVGEHPEDFTTTLAMDYPDLEPNDGSGDWVSLSICGRCSNVEQTGLETEYIRLPCPTLRLLALPYADHPDYRPEWRP